VTNRQKQHGTGSLSRYLPEEFSKLETVSRVLNDSELNVLSEVFVEEFILVLFFFFVIISFLVVGGIIFLIFVFLFFLFRLLVDFGVVIFILVVVFLLAFFSHVTDHLNSLSYELLGHDLDHLHLLELLS